MLDVKRSKSNAVPVGIGLGLLTSVVVAAVGYPAVSEAAVRNERARKLYEELGREDVRAVQKSEEAEQKIAEAEPKK